jgi:thiamine biosynthesis lipoprotein
MEATLLRHRFRAMGTEIELLVEAEEAAHALAAAEEEFHRLEALLSRFRPDSELSRLNAAGRLAAGPDLLRVVGLAFAAHAHTGGRFDIRVHDALVAAGYDRSFELVPAETDARPGMASVLNVEGQVSTDIHVQDGEIRLAEGVRIDLGGIGKGYACERAAEILATAGSCLVNAGGDIATRGGTWTVAVETSGEPLTLELSASSALATSGSDTRRWHRGGRELHHLIDPATGLPSDSDLLRVTAVADSAVDAEVTAKALFLAGSEAARTEADAGGIPAVLVTRDGRTILAGGLA